MEFNSKNTIVYTALIGQNEGLNSQSHIESSNFRHVCLTDNLDLKSNDWEIINVKRLFPKDQHRSQRNLKIRPHLIFPEYKYSFYIDNTIVLNSNVEEIIQKLFLKEISDKNDPFFVLPYHSFRENLISEFYECYLNKLDSDIRFFDQISDYLNTDILAFKSKPYWGGMLFRHHMHPKFKEFSEIWFANVVKYSRRDQLSLIHSSLQLDFKITGFDLNLFSSKYHNWPVVKQERLHRGFDGNLYKLPEDFFKSLLKVFSLSEEEILRYDFQKEIDRVHLNYRNSIDQLKILEFEKENLFNELELIKGSKIWKYSSIFRKILDKIKFKISQ